MISKSKYFLFIAVSVADGAAVKPNILNGLTTDFNKVSLDFNHIIIIMKTQKFD